MSCWPSLMSGSLPMVAIGERRLRAERAGIGRVHLYSLAGQQLVVQRLLQERVPERVLPLAVRLDQLLRDELVDNPGVDRRTAPATREVPS